MKRETLKWIQYGLMALVVALALGSEVISDESTRRIVLWSIIPLLVVIGILSSYSRKK